MDLNFGHLLSSGDEEVYQMGSLLSMYIKIKRSTVQSRCFEYKMDTDCFTRVNSNQIITLLVGKGREK